MEPKTIKVFPEGTEIIRRGEVDQNVDIVIIPHSIKEIETNAFYGIGYPWTFIYVGTIKEFENVNINEGISTPCINCVDGLKILAL